VCALRRASAGARKEYRSETRSEDATGHPRDAWTRGTRGEKREGTAGEVTWTERRSTTRSEAKRGSVEQPSRYRRSTSSTLCQGSRGGATGTGEVTVRTCACGGRHSTMLTAPSTSRGRMLPVPRVGQGPSFRGADPSRTKRGDLKTSAAACTAPPAANQWLADGLPPCRTELPLALALQSGSL
jgi:hypothetical protein